LETDSEVYHAIENAEKGIPFMVLLAEMPFLGRLFTRPWVLRLVGPKKTDEKGLGKMLG